MWESHLVLFRDDDECFLVFSGFSFFPVQVGDIPKDDIVRDVLGVVRFNGFSGDFM